MTKPVYATRSKTKFAPGATDELKVLEQIAINLNSMEPATNVANAKAYKVKNACGVLLMFERKYTGRLNEVVSMMLFGISQIMDAMASAHGRYIAL